MPTPLYHAIFHPLRLKDGRCVEGLTFVVDQQSPQYAGRLHPQTCAEHVREAVGISGSSRDYLLNTISHLDQLGLHDSHLSAIAAAL